MSGYCPECGNTLCVCDEKDILRHRLALQDERIRLLHEVAHRTWHLMDDSGEMDDPSDYMHDALDHQRVSDALDALEADGWTAHDA